MDTSAVQHPGTATPVKPQRRRWLVPVAVAVVAVVVAGIVIVLQPGSEDAPTVAEQASTAGGAATLVEGPFTQRQRLTVEIAKRRTAALLAGDEAAWLTDIDPTATTVIASEKIRFANLRQLRLKYFDLLPRDYDKGVFAETRQANGRIVVEEIMQLPADAERSATIANWYIDFDGDQARIRNISAGSDTESVNHAPWDDVPLRSAHAGNVTVLAPANSAWDPKTYLPGAQRAAALMRSLWGARLAVPGFVIFLADSRQYRTWFNNGADTDGSTGFTTYAPVVETDGRGRVARPNPTALGNPNNPAWIERAAGSRIVLDIAKLTGVREAQRVFVHEMAHAIGPHLIEAKQVDGDNRRSANQAIWPIEGFARWTEFLDDPSYGSAAMRTVRAGRSKYQPKSPFPDSDAFYAADSRRRSYNYNVSSSLYLAAAQTGDRQKTVDLYICLTNQREFLTDTEFLIDVCLKGVGLNPDKVWPRQRSLTR